MSTEEEKQTMNAVDERFMIYAALALLCSAVGAFLGTAAGLWSFVQIAAVIEFLYWLGRRSNSEPIEPQSN